MATNPYQIGNEILLKGTFTNSGGTLITPTTITLRIKNPAGTVTVVTTASLTNPSTGIYQYTLLLNVKGIWSYRFEGAGNVVVASEEEIFVIASLIV